MSNNDKWLMFKNYMHNELGITRDDIHQWLMDAVKEEAKRLVAQEFGKFDVKALIRNYVESTDIYGERLFKTQIISSLVDDMRNRIELRIKDEDKE